MTDPASNVTGYGYDATTGRLSSITDPAGTKQYFAYSLRGALLHTWGEGVYPVEYYYDVNYGRRTDMQTFRYDTYDFSTATWPDPDLGDGEVTTWAYEPATGLVLSKTDAAGKAVTYTYTDAGRLKTRTWARPDGPNPLVTTYNYDPNTGELTGVDYSDATPDVTFTYDRLGRRKTVTDVVGTRTFAYNSVLQLEHKAACPLCLPGRLHVATLHEGENLPKWHGVEPSEEGVLAQLGTGGGR